MPRPRKTQPLTLPPVSVDIPAPTPRTVQMRTRTSMSITAHDDREVALLAAESAANKFIALFEEGGAQIVSVSTQVLCVERFTRWQIVVTIVYRESV